LPGVFDAAPFLVAYVDSAMRFRAANACYAAWFGIPHDTIPGKHVREILGDDAFERVRAYVEAALDGEMTSYETEMPYVSGGHRYVHADLIPDRAEDGTVRGFIAAIRDISARRRMEVEREAALAALGKSEAELRYLATHARCLIWHGTVYDDGHWDTEVVDEEAAQAFLPLEMDPGERYTRAWYRHRLPEGKRLTDAVSTEALRTGKPEYSAEFGCRSRSGEVRWFSEQVHVEPLDPGMWRVIGVCVDITERRQAAEERVALTARIAEESQRQRAFLRDVLYSVSEGRLRLCETAADLPAPLPGAVEAVALSKPTLGVFRRRVQDVACASGLPDERVHDLITAVGEAAMNAVVHAGGGEGRVCADKETGTVQVWVTDNGAGIGMEYLHKAMLERGFTTAGTFGHGFWLMLKTADRIHLLTGQGGTTVVIEQDREPPAPGWLRGTL
jgi:PAS domain S-box-containing protein